MVQTFIRNVPLCRTKKNPRDTRIYVRSMYGTDGCDAAHCIIRCKYVLKKGMQEHSVTRPTAAVEIHLVPGKLNVRDKDTRHKIRCKVQDTNSTDECETVHFFF